MVCLQGSALSSHGPGRPFPGPGSCSDAHTRMFSQHNRAVRLCPVTNRHSRTEKSTSTAGEIHPPTPPPTKPRARCAHSCYHFLHRRPDGSPARAPPAARPTGAQLGNGELKADTAQCAQSRAKTRAREHSEMAPRARPHSAWATRAALLHTLFPKSKYPNTRFTLELRLANANVNAIRMGILKSQVQTIKLDNLEIHTFNTFLFWSCP